MKKLSLFFLSFLLISCKGGGGGGGESSSLLHYGVYQNCEYDSDTDVSTRNLVYANETLLSEVITYYNQAGCTPGNEVFDERYIYSYEKSGSNFHLTIEGLVTTSLTASDVNYNNTNSYCGYANWILNVPKNILGRNCSGNTINQGDFLDVVVKKSGNNLIVKTENGSHTYALTGAWNFSAQGQTILDGSYAYYNGSVGAYLTTNAGNYSLTYYDPTTQRYFTEAGTYTSANNSMDFTVVSYTPDCGTDEGITETRKFAQTSFSLAIQGVGDKDILFEKVPFTNTQFRDAYLGSGYAAGCF